MIYGFGKGLRFLHPLSTNLGNVSSTLVLGAAKLDQQCMIWLMAMTQGELTHYQTLESLLMQRAAHKL